MLAPGDYNEVWKHAIRPPIPFSTIPSLVHKNTNRTPGVKITDTVQKCYTLEICKMITLAALEFAFIAKHVQQPVIDYTIL